MSINAYTFSATTSGEVIKEGSCVQTDVLFGGNIGSSVYTHGVRLNSGVGCECDNAALWWEASSFL